MFNTGALGGVPDPPPRAALPQVCKPSGQQVASKPPGRGVQFAVPPRADATHVASGEPRDACPTPYIAVDKNCDTRDRRAVRSEAAGAAVDTPHVERIEWRRGPTLGAIRWPNGGLDVRACLASTRFRCTRAPNGACPP